jgi:hypothetical protein
LTNDGLLRTACDVRIPPLERAFSRHLYVPAQCHSRHRLNHFFLACVPLQRIALHIPCVHCPLGHTSPAGSRRRLSPYDI